jgi:hypothetical protein
MADGGTCAFHVGFDECGQMIEALCEKQSHGWPDRQWLPVGLDINWEDAGLVCSHTDQPIESAYGE